MNEKDDKAIITEFLHLNCVRNYAIHQACEKYATRGIYRINHWRIISQSALDMAVIEWCKLFGSYGDSTHWQKNSIGWIDDVKKEILPTVKMTAEEWSVLHTSIKDYRDKNVAHIDIEDWRRIVPYMNKALGVLYFSYDMFVEKLKLNRPEIREEFINQQLETEDVIRTYLKL